MAERIDEALGADGELAALRQPPLRRVKPGRAVAADDIEQLILSPLGVNGRSADADYVQSVRETNQKLVSLDSLYGGQDILPLALRLFRAVYGKLGAGRYEARVERDLGAAAGETGEIAAWLAYDADRQGVSRQIIHEALMLSRQAGDRDMELFELGHLAMQSVYLHRPHEALRITDAVLEDSSLPPRVSSMFEIRRGRALAQGGDRSGALDALRKARSTLADGIGNRDPFWT